MSNLYFIPSDWFVGSRRKSRDPSPSVSSSSKTSVQPDEEIPLGTINSKLGGTTQNSLQSTSSSSSRRNSGNSSTSTSSSLHGGSHHMHSTSGMTSTNTSAPSLHLKFPSSGSNSKITSNKFSLSKNQRPNANSSSNNETRNSVGSMNSSIMGVPLHVSHDQDSLSMEVEEESESNVTTPQSETSFMTTFPTHQHHNNSLNLYPTVATTTQVPVNAQSNSEFYSIGTSHYNNHSSDAVSTVLNAPQFQLQITSTNASPPSSGRKKKGTIETV